MRDESTPFEWADANDLCNQGLEKTKEIVFFSIFTLIYISLFSVSVSPFIELFGEKWL